MSRAVMAQHHAEIVRSAADLLRVRGIDGMSVADLMESVGLTHGGFYRHFASKEELVAAAASATFKAIFELLDARTGGGGTRAALEFYIAEYLSDRHLSQPSLGCPVAAYGAEAPRKGDVISGAFAQGIEQQVSWVARCLAGQPRSRRARAVELVSLLVGTIVAARASGNSDLAREILATGRRRVKALIAEAA